MAKLSNCALFDSLSHPTISGAWFGRDVDASFLTLSRNLRRSNFKRACAVGLADHEGYSHEQFLIQCAAFPELVPIAGVVPKDSVLIGKELDAVADLGFRGIKLHPRLSRFTLSDPMLLDTFQAAAKRELPIFLCTYFHTPHLCYPETDPLYDIAKLMRECPTARIVLLHGGTVELLRWMQFARHEPRVLFDVSFTLMKYRGSSLDRDLEWLFQNFNERTCFGVDHPEYNHAEVEMRFEQLSSAATADAKQRVAGLNLARFLDVEFV